jgi:replicative DNA helicase
MQNQNITSEILDRLPPQNLDAEKAVIGSLLLDSRLADDVAAIIRADDFYADANRKLYAHVLAISTQNRWIDSTILINRLKQTGDLEAVGGGDYLIEVARSVPYAANAVYYARIVREKSIRRNLIHAATETLRDAYDETIDAGEIISATESSLSSINTSDGESRLKSASESAIDAMVFLDKISQQQSAAGLMTGLETFDQNFGGLFSKELIVLAARPSCGKTSLARQIVRYNGGSGRLTYFVSLEMDAVQQTILSLCSLANVNNMQVRTGDLQLSDVSKLATAGNRYGQLPIYIEDRPRMKAADILRRARRLKRQDLRLIVVDYLQLIEPSNRKIDRHLQVGEIARDLKSIAMELDIPVLCLAQINRESVKSGSGPELHHLKESGDIEQHADVVMFLHEDYLRVKKNRNGPKGKIRLRWQPEITTFSCADEPPPPNYNPEFSEYEQQ